MPHSSHLEKNKIINAFTLTEGIEKHGSKVIYSGENYGSLMKLAEQISRMKKIPVEVSGLQSKK